MQIDPATFRQLAAAGHTRIPVVREVLSDLDTPLSVYLKFADAPNSYLFESVEGGETWGRHSIIGLPARRTYAFRGHTLEVREYGEPVETREVADPLGEVERLRAAHSVPRLDGLPAFTGGLVGWFGFESIAARAGLGVLFGEPAQLAFAEALSGLPSEEQAAIASFASPAGDGPQTGARRARRRPQETRR